MKLSGVTTHLKHLFPSVPKNLQTSLSSLALFLETAPLIAMVSAFLVLPLHLQTIDRISCLKMSILGVLKTACLVLPLTMTIL